MPASETSPEAAAAAAAAPPPAAKASSEDIGSAIVEPKPALEVIFDKASVDGKTLAEKKETTHSPAPTGNSGVPLSISPPSHPERSRSRSLALENTRSYGDGHGYTFFVKDGNDDDTEAQSPSGVVREWEVKFEGEEDEMNPKNMSKGRKWAVTVVVSAGSTCV